MPDLFRDIAPAKALGIRLNSFANGCAVLVAPFGPNRNDKGTAFAGSIASMLSLAGWTAITLSLRDAGVEADVAIVTSDIEYLSAARAALFAETKLSREEIERVLQELKLHGRARIQLNATLHSEGTDRATLAGSYAVLAHG